MFRHNCTSSFRNSDGTSSGGQQNTEFFNVRLQAVLTVMKHYFPDELSDFNHRLLLQQPVPQGLTVLTNAKMSFYVGGLPCTKSVSRGDGDNRTTTTELMEYIEIEASNLRRQKCICFPVNVSMNMNTNMPYLPDASEVLIKVTRKNREIEINFYEHVLAGNWKGFRVLPCDVYDSDDSDEFANENQVESFIVEFDHMAEQAQRNLDNNVRCYGCLNECPDQESHMGPDGCFTNQESAAMESDNDSL